MLTEVFKKKTEKFFLALNFDLFYLAYAWSLNEVVILRGEFYYLNF